LASRRDHSTSLEAIQFDNNNDAVIFSSAIFADVNTFTVAVV